MRRACVAFAALAACARYEPAPVDPAAGPAAYRARRLDDTAAVAFVARWSERPETVWTDRQLALLALRHSPAADAARAAWRAARAGETTARRRPRPGAQGDLERAVGGETRESPWVASLAALFTLELGGKRGARVAAARARAVGAEAALQGASRDVASGVREAVLGVVVAERERGDADSVAVALREVAELAERRYREGAGTAAEVALARAESRSADLAASAARGAGLSARARLAGRLALPARELETVPLGLEASPGCAAADAGGDTLATTALTRRPEMAEALAAYAEAEAGLRGAVADQYPNLVLGPGFVWDQGVQRWALALGLPALATDRNRGPIAEATARRRQAGARVRQAQESLLADVDAAVAGCRATALDVAAADSAVAVSERRAELARAAYARGETGRQEVALAEVAALRARMALRAASARRVAAGVSLERVAALWGPLAEERWPDPRNPPRTEEVP